MDGVAYLLGTRPLLRLGPQELGDRDDRLGVGVRTVLREPGGERLGEPGGSRAAGWPVTPSVGLGDIDPPRHPYHCRRS